ncbi:hypothetical protein HBA54_03280 [Pelagibius litoralis]|uniref:Uncharacterized protein n=1 Tax=Pelagibius litoralis TaxID=374515 RepID=A0A967C3J4_9PROT|nr:hypothetical protein [Pelagibius litoralis]NIA67605.1 hypothetical protein [Pelagibius litoralis]
MHATDDNVYPASPVKRRRATKAEMEARATFLIGYAGGHHPVTVRGLYYQAGVHRVPGIDKTDNGYDKVQNQCLKLRRAGRLDYDWIADATRWMRKPRTYSSAEDAVQQTAALYRKALWHDADSYVEIWCEKNALAGVILPVTSLYDVPLMVTGGFSSETFCYEAVAQRGDDDRPYYVYYLGDFDRAGRDAARSLEEKLTRFADETGVEVLFKDVAVTAEQVRAWSLPTRPPKRKSPADRKWPYTFACELDAIPPDRLRQIVKDAIDPHLPQQQLNVLKVAEESERELLLSFAEALQQGRAD